MKQHSEEGYCRSCGAPITWAVTDNGKPIQVDSDPCNDGNVDVCREAGTLRARVLSPRQLEELRDDEYGTLAELYKAHFSSCPDAKHWRKS